MSDIREAILDLADAVTSRGVNSINWDLALTDITNELKALREEVALLNADSSNHSEQSCDILTSPDDISELPRILEESSDDGWRLHSTRVVPEVGLVVFYVR
jgi:hypothetical protein